MKEELAEGETTNRRALLALGGALASMGLLSGCQSIQEENEGEVTASVTSMGDDEMLTFGHDDAWGVQYNSVSREFEVIHNPGGATSRRNIRIEADENQDRGDVYIDDSLIIRNEAEVSDGTVNDPSYTFANQNNTGLWRIGSGALGVATRGTEAVRFDSGHLRVSGDITTGRSGTLGPRTTVWDAAAGHAPSLPSTSARVSGDGSTRQFSLPNPIDEEPSQVTVTPTSRDASGEFWVNAKTASSVEITYETPPPAGSENLRFDLIASK